MEEFESFETVELTYQCKECGNTWVEFQEFICESECDECGTEQVRAIKVRDIL